jgi:hypothetical protein
MYQTSNEYYFEYYVIPHILCSILWEECIRQILWLEICNGCVFLFFPKQNPEPKCK